MATREEIINRDIQTIGSESFPDDDVNWEILDIVNDGGYYFVETAPDSDDVGYEKFIIILKFTDAENYVVAGCFCWEDEQWNLLFTDALEESELQKAFDIFGR
ncbi:MAG: hypothetical protein ACYTFY_21075 [Planctomycetota bacterium]|jgi:hypothetical protein